MTFFEQATQADVDQDLRAAMRLYEHCGKAEADPSTREAALLNLFFIYWYCTSDYGVYSSLLTAGFTEAELAHTYERKTAVEQVLTSEFISSYETCFWLSYIREEETLGNISAAHTVAQMPHEPLAQALAAFYVVDRAVPRVANPTAAGAPSWALTLVEHLQEQLAHEPLTTKNRFLVNHIASMLWFHRQ